MTKEKEKNKGPNKKLRILAAGDIHGDTRVAEKLAETPTLDEDTLIELLMNLPFDNTSLKSMWPDEMVCSYFGKSK